MSNISSAATSTASLLVDLSSPIGLDPRGSLPDLSRSPPTDEAIGTLEEESVETPGVESSMEPNRKRFSLAALAVDTEPVTTRPSVSGEGRSKRFSLLLGGRSFHKKSGQTEGGEQGGFDHGIAVGKLAEILGRERRKS